MFAKIPFSITATPKSAEFTKPYEFLLRIGWSSTQITQNDILGTKGTFPPKSALGAKSILFRKMQLMAKGLTSYENVQHIY